MLDLPDRLIIFDCEWTAWEGSLARNWSGPSERREIYDIGAIRVDGTTLEELGAFHRYVRLHLTERLPAYSERLTGITQGDLDRDGIPFSRMLRELVGFVEDSPMYCWGADQAGFPVDGAVIMENCRLKDIEVPFAEGRFVDVQCLFSVRGIAAKQYHSSTITRAFGVDSPFDSHQGLCDARTILHALRLLSASRL